MEPGRTPGHPSVLRGPVCKLSLWWHLPPATRPHHLVKTPDSSTTQRNQEGCLCALLGLWSQSRQERLVPGKAAPSQRLVASRLGAGSAPGLCPFPAPSLVFRVPHWQGKGGRS